MPFPWLLRQGQILCLLSISTCSSSSSRWLRSEQSKGLKAKWAQSYLWHRSSPLCCVLRSRKLHPAIGWSRIHNLRNTDREKQAFSVLVQQHLVFSLTGCSLHLTAQRKHPRVSCSEPLPQPTSQWMQLLKGSGVGRDGVLSGIIPSIWRRHSAASEGSSLSKWKMGFTSLRSHCGLLPLRYYFWIVGRSSVFLVLFSKSNNQIWPTSGWSLRNTRKPRQGHVI